MELLDLVNSVLTFLSQITLFRWLTFLLGSLTVALTALLFWTYFSSDASICSTMTFPPLGNSDHVVVSVSIYFLSNSKRDAPLRRIASDYSRADWDNLRNHLRNAPWENIFERSLLAVASGFCEWLQVGFAISHSSPWFSVAGDAATAHRNLFFLVCTNRINLWI